MTPRPPVELRDDVWGTGPSVVSEIQLRNQAQALVDQLRPIIKEVSDSDRFAIFRAVTADYCPECGKGLDSDGSCDDCYLTIAK